MQEKIKIGEKYIKKIINKKFMLLRERRDERAV